MGLQGTGTSLHCSSRNQFSPDISVNWHPCCLTESFLARRCWVGKDEPFPCWGATFTQARGQCEMELMDGMGSHKSRSWQKIGWELPWGKKREYILLGIAKVPGEGKKLETSMSLQSFQNKITFYVLLENSWNKSWGFFCLFVRLEDFFKSTVFKENIYFI